MMDLHTRQPAVCFERLRPRRRRAGARDFGAKSSGLPALKLPSHRATALRGLLGLAVLAALLWSGPVIAADDRPGSRDAPQGEDRNGPPRAAPESPPPHDDEPHDDEETPSEGDERADPPRGGGCPYRGQQLELIV